MAAIVSAAASARAEIQVFNLYDFQLEDGTIMPELRLAYETHGSLAPGRDNAIILLHEALGDRNAFDGMVGPGKVFDTDRYFVITADALGGGESAAPSDGQGQEFPRYTIRDMMAAEYGLVARGLGLTRVQAIVGRSMGAMIGLEWAIHHPDMLRHVVLLAPSPRSDANYRLIVDLMVSSLALDPEWNGGRYERNPVEGLRHAGMTYYPWSVTADHLDEISPAELAHESEATAKAFAAWDANSLMMRLAACRSHDVAASFGGDLDAALARATMPVLLMPSVGDRLIGLAGARHLRAGLPRATYAEIPGELGHRAVSAPAGSTESDFIARAIRGFLK